MRITQKCVSHQKGECFQDKLTLTGNPKQANWETYYQFEATVISFTPPRLTHVLTEYQTIYSSGIMGTNYYVTRRFPYELNTYLKEQVWHGAT